MKNIHFKIDESGFVTPEINNGIIENENKVTLITADFPDSCQGFEKFLIFKTKKPVELIDGSKSRVPQVLLSDEGYILPASVVNAEIKEVAFKALGENGICFTTEVVRFIPLCGTITSDSLAPAALPTGFLFEGGDNVGIEDSREGSIRKVKIELKTPLDQKLLTSDIERLDTLLSGKQEKIVGKSLLADSEVLRLKNDLSGKASGINTGDETVTSIKVNWGLLH